MKSSMEKKMRKSGIYIIEDIPWGTHFCQFYKTKKDLTDILVPYFKAGLENNEFCFWVTSDPLKAKEAESALRKAVKNLDKYIKKGQIEIIEASQWYTKDGKFEAEKALKGWLKREKDALKKRFDGIRLSGNTFWLRSRDWKPFMDYEGKVQDLIENHRMITVCNYSLQKCGPSEAIDIAYCHQFSLVKRKGKWIRVENTEHKKKEKALQESEKKYRTLAENAIDGIYIISPEGFEYVNPAFEKILGYKAKEVCSKEFDFFDLIHPEDRKLIAKREEARKRGKKLPPVYSFRVLTKKRQLKNVEVHTVPLPGEKVKILGILSDITERKKTEEGLRKNEELFRSVVENSHAGILIVDESYRVVYANDEMYRIAGYTHDEIIGQDFRKFLDEESRQLVADRYVRRQKGEKVPSRYEFNVVHKSGEERRVEISSAVIKDSSGKMQTVAQVLDITERKKAEEKLRAEKAYLDQLFESAQEGIVMADKEGRARRVNSEFIRLFGYTAEEARGRHVDELVVPKSEIDKGVSITKNVAKGGSSAFEATRQRKDGTLIDVSVLASPIILDGEVVDLYAIYRDITERKRAEEAIRIRKSQLELVHRIQNDIPMNMDIETILKSAAESIGRSFGYNRVSVNLFDEDRQELMHIIGWNRSGPPTPRGHRQKIGEGLIGKAAQLKKTIIANDVSKEPSYVVFYQAETKSELTIPLIVQDHLVGVLDVQDVEKNMFKKDDVSVLQSIANYIAYVIDEKQTEEMLRVSEEKYRNLVELSPDAVLFLDLEGIITSCNNFMMKATGYSKEEIVGKSLRELEFLPDEDIPKYIKFINKAAKGKIPKPFEVIWHHKDGTSYLAEVRVGFIKENGKNVGLQVVARDMTERKKAEELTKTSLKEKEVMLREIHHRVKNNMQIISSLLRLQSRQITNQKILDMFNVGQNRIRSMALIHESLYQSNDLARINFSDYIKRLTTHLFSIYRTELDSINLRLNVKDVFLDINRAIPSGLIINELVSNSLKHAFPDGKRGEITVAMNKNKRDRYTLIVIDTGIGFPEGLDFQNTETLGMQLVTDLVRQLDGRIKLSRSKGTTFKVVF